MTTGSVRRRNGRWQARYRGPDTKQRSRTFDRKLDAERWLNSETASLGEGRWIDPRDSNVRVADFAEVWLEARAIREQTRADYERVLRLHFLPKFGDRPLSSIRKSEIEGWMKGLTKVKAASSVEVILRITGALFNSAVDDRLLSVSPQKGVAAPKPTPKLIVPLVRAEVEALIEAAPAHYKALVAFAAGSGLREGECFGVTTSSLKMLRREVSVGRQLVQLDSGPPRWGPLKTAASTRIVPLADVTLEAVSRHMAQFPLGEDGVIFTNDRGEWNRRISFGQAWRRIVKRSGVQREGRVLFHELRHAYASMLIEAGESQKVVQSRMGHSSLAQTTETYVHLWPDNEDKTRAAVQRALTGS